MQPNSRTRKTATLSNHVYQIGVGIIVLFLGMITFGQSGDANSIARFDRIIFLVVEKEVLKPVTDQGGEIAWSESYQLAALVEMFDATRDAK